MDAKAAYAVVIHTPFELLTLFSHLSFTACHWSILKVVLMYWPAWTLEVTGYSQSPVSDFCLDVTLHNALGKDMTSRGSQKN